MFKKIFITAFGFVLLVLSLEVYGGRRCDRCKKRQETALLNCQRMHNNHQQYNTENALTRRRDCYKNVQNMCRRACGANNNNADTTTEDTAAANSINQQKVQEAKKNAGDLTGSINSGALSAGAIAKKNSNLQKKGSVIAFAGAGVAAVKAGKCYASQNYPCGALYTAVAIGLIKTGKNLRSTSTKNNRIARQWGTVQDDDKFGGYTSGFDGGTDNNTDGTTDNNTDGTTDNNTDGTTDNNTDGTTDNNTDGTTDNNTDGTTDNNTDGTTDNNTDGTTDNNTDGTTDNNTDGTTDNTDDTTDNTDDTTDNTDGTTDNTDGTTDNTDDTTDNTDGTTDNTDGTTDNTDGTTDNTDDTTQDIKSPKELALDQEIALWRQGVGGGGDTSETALQKILEKHKVKVDPKGNIVLPDGKKLNLQSAKAKMSPGQLKGFNKFQKKLADLSKKAVDISSDPKKTGNKKGGFRGYGAGGGGENRAPSGTDTALLADNFGFDTSSDEENSGSSVAGMAVRKGGSLIGVRHDNIFDMIHRRYKKKHKKKHFVD